MCHYTRSVTTSALSTHVIPLEPNLNLKKTINYCDVGLAIIVERKFGFSAQDNTKIKLMNFYTGFLLDKLA